MTASGPVVVRFAPSPTGFLHIGGARTALFNWLFARHHARHGAGGAFLLRIEDTDRARSTEAAIAAIFEGLKWLELDWDGEPTFQFARRERHAAVAHELIDQGLAYRCYATPDELQAMREAARAEGRPPVYDGRWRDRGPSDWPKDAPYAVRLKTPREGETTILDGVQGEVSWANAQLDDLILLRSDGTPTYMLAVVVDDHDMGVTDVIRGDDHLTNAARQRQIYDAMGWSAPRFAHIPLIHGPDGAKLSKRHGALGVEAYRDMGLLPEALRNYLARLGWAHGDDEIFSSDQAIDWFRLDGVGKAAARFDMAKLTAVNGQWMRRSDDATLTARAMAHFSRQKVALTETAKARLTAAMPGLKERAKTLAELTDQAAYLLHDEAPEPDAKAAKLLNPEARQRLARLTAILRDVTDWTSGELETAVRRFAEAEGVKLGAVAQPLRAGLTGRAISPGVFDVLAVLGRDISLARLGRIAG